MNHNHQVNPETRRLVGDENAYETLAAMLEQASDDKSSEAA